MVSWASKNMDVELVYLPALTTFRCSLAGSKMKSCNGYEVDRFRDFLREKGYRYQETPLSLTPNREGYYFLPAGIMDVPCYRIGEQYIFKRNETEIRKAYVEAYMAQVR